MVTSAARSVGTLGALPISVKLATDAGVIGPGVAAARADLVGGEVGGPGAAPVRDGRVRGWHRRRGDDAQLDHVAGQVVDLGAELQQPRAEPFDVTRRHIGPFDAWLHICGRNARRSMCERAPSSSVASRLNRAALAAYAVQRLRGCAPSRRTTPRPAPRQIAGRWRCAPGVCSRSTRLRLGP